MLKSETIKTISVSLVKAQRNMTGATKDAKNPFFKSTYADLSAVIDACVPALNDQGIFVSQVVTTRARPDNTEVPTLETVFLHESGEFIGSQTDIIMKVNGNAQDYGSAVSYARRYGLQALAGLKAADDDGNGASGKVVTTITAPLTKHVSSADLAQAVADVKSAPKTETTENVQTPPKSFRKRTATTPQEDVF